MAGDWIKMESSTPDKPEVLAITAALGWDDPDMTVGKLFRVWRWFDSQTVNGNAPGVTAPLLDRIAGVTGFSAAMVKVGWLIATEDGLSLPNFERHNGKTAKDRAQTAKRVATYKAKGNDEANGDGNAPNVSDALPREEKRRSKNTPAKTQDEPAGFTRFWKAWPATDRKNDKPGCLRKWLSKKLEPLADRILADVEVSKHSKSWREGFEPAPATYLNQRRWEKDATAEANVDQYGIPL